MPKMPRSISELPAVPAVYALYGGQGRGLHVAYVGVADRLKDRIKQHLVRRDSSIATGTSAVGLNPDYVTEVRWWEHTDFLNRDALEAAELVAFEALDPALRSRGRVTGEAKRLFDDSSWKNEMRSLFLSEASGCLAIPSLLDALDRIADLEERMQNWKIRFAENSLVPLFVTCVEHDVALAEICGVLRRVFGEYRPSVTV
jgi:hypothetical protein